MPRLLKSLQRLFISFSIKAKVLTVTRTVLRVSFPTSALTSHDPSHDPTFTLLQPHTGLLPAPPGVPGALLPSCLLFSVPGTPRIPRHSSAISTLPGTLSLLPGLTNAISPAVRSPTTLFRIAPPLWHLRFSSPLSINLFYLLILLIINLPPLRCKLYVDRIFFYT